MAHYRLLQVPRFDLDLDGLCRCVKDCASRTDSEAAALGAALGDHLFTSEREQRLAGSDELMLLHSVFSGVTGSKSALAQVGESPSAEQLERASDAFRDTFPRLSNLSQKARMQLLLAESPLACGSELQEAAGIGRLQLEGEGDEAQVVAIAAADYSATRPRDVIPLLRPLAIKLWDAGAGVWVAELVLRTRQALQRELAETLRRWEEAAARGVATPIANDDPSTGSRFMRLLAARVRLTRLLEVEHDAAAARRWVSAEYQAIVAMVASRQGGDGGAAAMTAREHWMGLAPFFCTALEEMLDTLDLVDAYLAERADSGTAAENPLAALGEMRAEYRPDDNVACLRMRLDDGRDIASKVSSATGPPHHWPSQPRSIARTSKVSFEFHDSDGLLVVTPLSRRLRKMWFSALDECATGLCIAYGPAGTVSPQQLRFEPRLASCCVCVL